MKKSRGFAVVEGLLILVIIAILAGTGWYVYNSHQKTQDIYANADASNSSTVSAAKKKVVVTKDSTADWVAYSSKDGQFSLKYPKTWSTATHPELCDSSLLLLGGNSSAIGVCGSENTGQIEVASSVPLADIAGGIKAAEIATGYKDITKQSVTVDGVSGERITGTATGQGDPQVPGSGSHPAGTKVTEYIFGAHGLVYAATYIQTPDYPDVLSDFNTMVTKTLKFSSS